MSIIAYLGTFKKNPGTKAVRAKCKIAMPMPSNKTKQQLTSSYQRYYCIDCAGLLQGTKYHANAPECPRMPHCTPGSRARVPGWVRDAAHEALGSWWLHALIMALTGWDRSLGANGCFSKAGANRSADLGR